MKLHNIYQLQKNLVLAGVWFFLLCLNVGISIGLRRLNIFYVPNPYPWGFIYGYFSSTLIALFVTWVLLYVDFMPKEPVSKLLILAGLWSNFLEKLVFGNVADYLNFWIGYINLADLQLITGIVLINYIIWVVRPDSSTS